MYARIRDEGLAHSHIMEYASGLFDGIGPRLTGSPNLAKANAWTREQFAAMGCANSHLESWGEFGMGWRQIHTSVDMASPDTAVFIAQATPWSPATPGEVTAEVIAVPFPKDEKDFDQWKGKLAGKVILLGKAPKINPDPAPLLEHYDAAKLQQIYEYPLDGNMQEQHVLPDDPKFWEDVFKRSAFGEKVAKFLADEHAVAILRSSYAGDGGTIRDDNSEQMSDIVYLKDHKQAIPSAVVANEAFGRLSRLLEHKVPVTVTLNIHTEFTGDHELGYNTVAEIPGTDPQLKDQVVMVGGTWTVGLRGLEPQTMARVRSLRWRRCAFWQRCMCSRGGPFGSRCGRAKNKRRTVRLDMLTNTLVRSGCRPNPSNWWCRSFCASRSVRSL